MRTIDLYNHRREVVGVAEYTKKYVVNVTYNNKIHYSDIRVPLDKFDDYKRRMDLKTEYELNQLTLDEILGGSTCRKY